MLRRLHIRGFVLVSELDLDLGSGFTVLTGETGAGKSILIDALKLALGGRAEASVVQPGAARAEIGAEFDLDPAVQAWLDEQGFEPGDGVVLLRRVVDTQGRSRAFVNGSAATLTQLRAAAELLVDIHGQHAWQSLARSDAARELLDAYAGAVAQARSCSAAWREHRQAVEQLHAAQQQAGQAEQQREELQARLDELERLAPQPDDWEALNAEHKRLAHAAEWIEHLQSAASALDDDDAGAVRQLGRAQQALQAAANLDPPLQALCDQLEQCRALAADLGHETAARLRQAEPDPQRLAELDARLSAWMGLARRHRVTPDALPQVWQDLRARLQEIERGADLAGLQRRVDAAHRALGDAAAELTRLRRPAAQRLAQGVQDLMQHLGMQGGRFDVGLRELEQVQAGGAEAVELLVAANPGSPLRPLGRVASGGELSRIALALAATTAAQQPVGTLIFDEVDAGIGGAVAHTVGRLLAELGRDRQVLAVTHLAQVAAHAGAHLEVRKTTSGDATESSLEHLAPRQRVAEVARMLGGDAASEVARAHAEELLLAAASAVPAAKKQRSKAQS